MNRPIKFKVWFPGSKLMTNEFDICEDISDLVEIFKNIYKIYETNPQSYILRQFTGLKDKNDVEIYEGDIVRVEYYGMGHGFGGPCSIKKNVVASIVFERGCFDIKTENGIMSDICRPDMVEVLGNIYENP